MQGGCTDNFGVEMYLTPYYAYSRVPNHTLPNFVVMDLSTPFWEERHGASFFLRIVIHSIS